MLGRTGEWKALERVQTEEPQRKTYMTASMDTRFPFELAPRGQTTKQTNMNSFLLLSEKRIFTHVLSMIPKDGLGSCSFLGFHCADLCSSAFALNEMRIRIPKLW